MGKIFLPKLPVWEKNIVVKTLLKNIFNPLFVEVTRESTEAVILLS